MRSELGEKVDTGRCRLRRLFVIFDRDPRTWNNPRILASQRKLCVSVRSPLTDCL